MTNQPTKLLKYIRKNNIRMSQICPVRSKTSDTTINYKTLFNVVHGYTDPKLKTMQIIARALKVELDKIF